MTCDVLMFHSGLCCCMPTIEELKESIRKRCELPEGWDVFLQRSGHAFEISGFDGEEMQERTLEIIHDGERDYSEVVILHADMPGRFAAQQLEMGKLIDQYSPIPAQVGVLQFDNADDAIDAVDKLADPAVLDELAELRDFVEQDSPLSVRAAVEQATNIDFESVTGTADSI